jgi:transcriptional regulator with XRE-family HTH domain
MESAFDALRSTQRKRQTESMNIGEALKIRRKALKLTLEQVAGAAEYDTGNLSRVENEKQLPTADVLGRLLTVLGLSSVSDLFWIADGDDVNTIDQVSVKTSTDEELQHDLLALDATLTPVMSHALPLVTAEQIMQGQLPDKPFVWVSEDDHMSGGYRPAPRGYHVVLRPGAKLKMGHPALIQIGDRRPVLRLVEDGGDALQIVPTSSSLQAVRLIEGDYRVLGVLVTAYPEPAILEMDDPNSDAQQQQPDDGQRMPIGKSHNAGHAPRETQRKRRPK